MTLPERSLFQNVRYVKKAAEEAIKKPEPYFMDWEETEEEAEKRIADESFKENIIKTELQKLDYYFHMLSDYPITSFSEDIKK